MTEDEGEAAHKLKEEIIVLLHAVTNQCLKGQTDEVQERIRLELTEQMRFWK